jgi:hypothetical protein
MTGDITDLLLGYSDNTLREFRVPSLKFESLIAFSVILPYSRSLAQQNTGTGQ